MHDDQARAVSSLTDRAHAVHAARAALQTAIDHAVADGLLVLANVDTAYDGTGRQTPILSVRVARPM